MAPRRQRIFIRDISVLCIGTQYAFVFVTYQVVSGITDTIR